MPNKRSHLMLCALAASVLLSSCGPTPPEEDTATVDTLSVVASFYPMYDFACKIGGDKVSVTNMVPTGTEPHDWEPSAADMVTLEQADLFFYNGAGLEHWVEDVLSAVSNPNLTAVEVSNGIPLLDSEDGADPHVWLSPLYAKQELLTIKDALSNADPDNAGYYEDNYTRWSEACDQLDEAFRQGLSDLKSRDVVVSHAAFGYLCKAYQLNEVAIEGLSPDSEPDPARMAEIQDFVTEHQVRVIFSEELLSPKVAQTIAAATGAVVETLNPLEGLTQEQLDAGEDYFSIMRENLDTLRFALGGDEV